MLCFVMLRILRYLRAELHSLSNSPLAYQHFSMSLDGYSQLTIYFLILCAYRWLFGEITCQLYAMCGVLFGLCSLTNLTALSSVCCLKVCFPNHGEWQQAVTPQNENHDSLKTQIKNDSDNCKAFFPLFYLVR